MQRKHAAHLINCAYLGFLAAGVVLPLLKSKRGKECGLRTLEAVGGSMLVGQALKRILPELRPDGKDKCSFPSTHTTYAFTVAAMAAASNRKQAPLWYIGAFLVGVARVKLHRHHWWDALAGAILGIGMTHGQLACKEGWLVPALEALRRRL